MKKENNVFMGVDQYGNTYHDLKHPRKELMERLGYKSASKQYTTNVVTNSHYHTGYIVGPSWVTLYVVKPYEGKMEFFTQE